MILTRFVERLGALPTAGQRMGSDFRSTLEGR